MKPLTLFFTCSSLLLHVAQAQDASIPPLWRKPSSSLPYDKRVQISQSTIGTVIGLFNATGQIGSNDQPGWLLTTENAHLLGAIAHHDLLVGTTDNQDSVLDHLVNLYPQANHPYNSFVGMFSKGSPDVDALTWAAAAMYAYRAYNNVTLRSLAEEIWDQKSQLFITQEMAESGTHPNRTMGFMSECNGVSVVGGIFNSDQDSSNTLVRSEVLGGFSTLSAYLFEATNEPQYGEAANLASQFIQSQLYNGSVVLEFINLTACAVTKTEANIHETGLFIEGLSVYLNTTMNETLQATLEDVVTSSIQFTPWTDDNGINTYAQALPSANTAERGRRATYIRGLHEAWARNVLGSSVANLTQSYINVQYNALLDLAGNNDTYRYSADWHGPPPSGLQPWGQLEALDTLNSAISFAAEQQATNGTAPPGNPPPSPTNSSNVSPSTSGKTKTILAVVISISGIFVFVLFLVLCHVWQRKKRLRRARFAVDSFRSASPQLDKEDSESSSSISLEPSLPTTSVSGLGVPYLSKSRDLNPTVASEVDVGRTGTTGAGSSSTPAHSRNATGSGITPDAPRAGTNHPGQAVPDDELATVPALVAQLSRVLARAGVQSGTSGADDPPPEYSTRI